MERSRESQTWRTLLRQCIKQPQDKQRIADAIGVKPITLQRWVRSESQPRDDKLMPLLQAVPREVHQEFARLLRQDFPALELQAESRIQIAAEIPSQFYASALSAHAHTSASLYPQAFFDLILQQMIRHLDPERRGLQVSIVCCVPPLNGMKVRSLRIIGGRGTAPWPNDQEPQTLFLGAESLAGAAVAHSRLVVVNSRAESANLFAIRWAKHEESAAAYPFLRKTQIAGCLLVSSACAYTFTDVMHRLIEAYGHLLALAFEPDIFFDARNIDLCLMPDYPVQEPFFAQFSRRVALKVTEAVAARSYLSLHDAQMRVWQEIEEALLQNSRYTNF